MEIDYATSNITNSDDLREKIHEIHNYMRNNGIGYGLTSLKVFNLFYGLMKIEEYGLNICKDYESDDAVAYWMNKDLCIADDGKIEPREVFVDALDYCIQEDLYPFSFESMEKVLSIATG